MTKRKSQLLIRDFTEAAVIENFRITKDKSLEKRCGTKVVYTFEHPIRCAYSVAEEDGEHIYAVAGNELFKLVNENSSFSAVSLGVLSDAVFADEKEPVDIFMFAGKLYIIGGGNYYCYNSVSLSPVEGYIPLIQRYTNANGVGEAFERKNLLTNKVRIRFCPDGTNHNFRIYGRVSSIDAVWVNGNREYDYTTEIGNYSTLIKFSTLFASNTNDIIEVYYTINTPSNREKVTSCKKAVVYGGDTDSRVFLFGGSDRAVIYPSEPSDAYEKSTLSGEYFPEGGEITVGDGNLSVNGAVRQFDRLAIFTGDGAFYTYPVDLGRINGIKRFTFPVFPLNSEVGTTKNAGSVLVENEPFALNPTGLYRFKSTSVRDERLAVRVETPAFVGLTREFIDNCKLYVNRVRGELWCYNGNNAAIYNARLGCWYRFTGIEANLMFTWNGEAAFCSGNRLFLFHKDSYDDDGTAFSAVYESNRFEFGNAFSNKTLYNFGISIERKNRSKVICQLESDKKDKLEFEFAFSDSETNVPAVFTTRARLGNIEHLKVRLESPANSCPLGIHEFMLNFK